MNRLLFPLCLLFACCAEKTTQQSPTPLSNAPLVHKTAETPAPAPVQPAPPPAPGDAGTSPLQTDGLSGRRVTQRPRMADSSPKTGKVVVEICVDAAGNVVSAVYRQQGSTTDDAELVEKSISWARQHKFAPSDKEKQCGTLTFNFRFK